MSKELLHTPEGFRDIYGNELAKKNYIEKKLQDIIHSYGFDDVQPPTLEFFDVFSKRIGTTPSKELYKYFDKDGSTLVLRPDFTPSIARCAAKYYCDELRPVRFSYLGNTFTNNSNLQGKLKEVTQMGAELINDTSVEADAEMISLVIESLKNTGLTRFQVSIGEVEYFKGLCEEAGLDEETELDLRACISGKNYFAAQDLINERNVVEPYRSILLKVADMFGNMTSLDEAKSLVKNQRSKAAIERLEKLYEVLKLYGVEEYISFDLGMLSQYNYYTGVIFRAYTYGVGDAVVKGGRYNNLLSQFGKDAPAIGFVIIIDDLIEALTRQKVAFAVPTQKKQITYNDTNFSEKLTEVKKLRANGEQVELVPES